MSAFSLLFHCSIEVNCGTVPGAFRGLYCVGISCMGISCMESFSHPAGLRIAFPGQEPSLPGKLIVPCRNENKASWAGAIPARKAHRTLPDWG